MHCINLKNNGVKNGATIGSADDLDAVRGRIERGGYV